jgi:hypothetical protein
MTTDELRVAAARYANPNPATAYPWPCDMHEQPAQRSADASMLARAYIAEHPADDETPVDEAWLRAAGFVRGKFPDDLVAGPILCGIVRNPISKDDGKAYWAVRTYPIPDAAAPKTRSDVRRLAAALGITLTESS